PSRARPTPVVARPPIRRSPTPPPPPYTTLFRSCTGSPAQTRSPPARKSIRGVGRAPTSKSCRALALHPCASVTVSVAAPAGRNEDRKSTRLNSSHVNSSYAVFCLKPETDGHGRG